MNVLRTHQKLISKIGEHTRVVCTGVFNMLFAMLVIVLVQTLAFMLGVFALTDSQMFDVGGSPEWFLIPCTMMFFSYIAAVLVQVVLFVSTGVDLRDPRDQ